jgi:hypothetical protein
VQLSYVHLHHLNLLFISMAGNPGDHVPVFSRSDREPSMLPHSPRTSSLGMQQPSSQLSACSGPLPHRPLPHLPKEAGSSIQATKTTGMSGPWAYWPPDQLPPCPGPPPDRPLPRLPKNADARASCGSETLPSFEPKIQTMERPEANWI